MKQSKYLLDNSNGGPLVLKETAAKYLRFWQWFLATVFLCLIFGYIYMRYATVSYFTEAKIKIIDETSEFNIAADPISVLSSKPSINLDNEIEIIKSYRILNQVVEELDLNVDYYEVGNIKTLQIWNPPFKVIDKMATDSLKNSMTYDVSFDTSMITINDEDGNKFITSVKNPNTRRSGLPFNLIWVDTIPKKDFNKNFKVVVNPKIDKVVELIKDIKVQPTNKNSEILSLTLVGESIGRNEAIINTTIEKFDQDGVLDRKRISQRTVDFIDERFLYLASELDSIEGDKESFKELNNLSNMDADVGITLQQKSMAEQEVSNLQTQISLSRLLEKTLVNERPYSILPADIGLQSSSINSLVSEYNRLALERERLIASAGINNPALQVLSGQLERGKQNIVQTVNVYQQQLQVSMNQLNRQKYRASSMFSSLPEKEKILRSIERQQGIKESLYILLLQKREEAAINVAVTAPTIKVVDYGLTNSKPVSPDKKIVYGLAFILGLFIPFAVLFTRFTLDTKVRSRSDIEKANPEIPVLTEIPFFENERIFIETGEHSLLAETFRILCTNVDFILPGKPKGECQVVFVTSTVKEEGKTLVALNLSLAYASLKKRVLLIGADLRNPTLHTYFNISKDSSGLSNYLYDPTIKIKDCIHPGYGTSDYHKVSFSGAIPPNAPVLLASDAFEKFIDLAKKDFDYIIVDTAPTLLVTDTLLISKYADATLFVVRAGFTDSRILKYSKQLMDSNKLKNGAYILNDVSLDKDDGYNFGYGYGYGATRDTEPWYKDIADFVDNFIKNRFGTR